MFLCIGRNDIHKSAKKRYFIFKGYFVRNSIDKSLYQKSKCNNELNAH